jgi:hypothetical protein
MKEKHGHIKSSVVYLVLLKDSLKIVLNAAWVKNVVLYVHVLPPFFDDFA